MLRQLGDRTWWTLEYAKIDVHVEDGWIIEAVDWRDDWHKEPLSVWTGEKNIQLRAEKS